MKTNIRQYAVKGFTLIELLIVVIIIAIMAAIAIPQFGNSTAEATDAALDANLNTVRSAIELYRVQHNNILPGVREATGAGNACTAAGGVAGTGLANTALAFSDQMTMHSNRAGQTCTVFIPGYDNGPYLRAIPRDPVTPAADANGNAVAVTNGVLAPIAAGGGAAGWRYSLVTGRFEMNSVALDRNQRAFNTH
ncbi:prepilin-type N-terminal cleavage/methylation domain-containing protein [Massilia sp. IC2-476]|uniref:prepilin-type N-terminal cleavage/methylation domain-containing protein n=1 Tax=Massilia sp. IC2-476 TaxID=2887199 RepID=UPI001D12E751|nr:prepilin-type N-terminal cleavage/methylation domain-containing protein [Massilia sp. IC2-476]MCC2972861.1 prepilin-type N-terminal cleavage/methylation domain-containing protein [Massilia sp. IC2-476]